MGMRIRGRTMLTVMALPVAITLACSDSTGIDLPALIITNTWEVQGQDRDFNFESGNDGATSGTFIGAESVNGVEADSLAGSWAGGDILIEMGDGREYTGSFHDLPDQLTVTSTTETIVLLRGG